MPLSGRFIRVFVATLSEAIWFARGVSSRHPSTYPILFGSNTVRRVFRKHGFWTRSWNREAGEDDIPHTYGNERPCFFDPKNDWRPDMKIAVTIIPWLSLWLFYYEVWRATGTWYGGGTHPTEFDPKED